jgi:chromosome segregation ATPase
MMSDIEEVRAERDELHKDVTTLIKERDAALARAEKAEAEAERVTGHMNRLVHEKQAALAAQRDCAADLAQLTEESDRAFLAGQQSLAHSLNAAESTADAWKAEAKKEKERADKFMWQVRDTCVRAEKAEADIARIGREMGGA